MLRSKSCSVTMVEAPEDTQLIVRSAHSLLSERTDFEGYCCESVEEGWEPTLVSV